MGEMYYAALIEWPLGVKRGVKFLLFFHTRTHSPKNAWKRKRKRANFSRFAVVREKKLGLDSAEDKIGGEKSEEESEVEKRSQVSIFCQSLSFSLSFLHFSTEFP